MVSIPHRSHQRHGGEEGGGGRNGWREHPSCGEPTGGGRDMWKMRRPAPLLRASRGVFYPFPVPNHTILE